ncbi:hypothetical protein BKA00_000611 [Actinomadura coerulea]|uniref:SCO6045-like C-terminal domain-containing protein n=1 Tax=Actinomadura coerulea TaxID=46159 RepID=A0A7X0FV28_9ACTN|nr:hypothetical protein [Actinomadura coerulea]MBB6393697.1 hypothetical protein [Actinomadura coerulea]GGP90958.1 hypothetical protein GCM10010187_02890 [Actinomadura coerulea]
MSGFDARLAAAQEALVRAMTAGGPMPEGFDAEAVRAAAHGILLKRAGEVARAWPALAASYGTSWKAVFAAWAAERPTRGSFRDGWDFARGNRDRLAGEAARELALAEARWSYDGQAPPRPRRAAARRVPGGAAVAFRGRVRVFGRNPSG